MDLENIANKIDHKYIPNHRIETNHNIQIGTV